MIATFCALLLLAAPAAPRPLADDKAPTANVQRAKLAQAEIEKALHAPDKDARLKAIQAHGDVADAEVARLLGRAARDKEPVVQMAAIQSLRWQGIPEALKELHALVRSEKSLRKDPASFARLLQAVGQYGDASSIAILADDVSAQTDAPVLRARILGLGQIRTAAAVEALIQIVKISGASKVQNLMPDLRLALTRLTGIDKGQSQALWQEWWNEQRAKFRVDPAPPDLARELQARWDEYWGRGERYERVRTRASRGRGDPDKG